MFLSPKEINVTGSQKVTDDGISWLLIQNTKSGISPREMVIRGKLSNSYIYIYRERNNISIFHHNSYNEYLLPNKY